MTFQVGEFGARITSPDPDANAGELLSLKHRISVVDRCDSESIQRRWMKVRMTPHEGFATIVDEHLLNPVQDSIIRSML